MEAGWPTMQGEMETSGGGVVGVGGGGGGGDGDRGCVHVLGISFCFCVGTYPERIRNVYGTYRRPPIEDQSRKRSQAWRPTQPPPEVVEAAAGAASVASGEVPAIRNAP